jgi:hypothetical protein
MFKLRYILKSLNVLNGLLAAAVAAVVFFVMIPFLDPAAVSLPTAKEAAAGSGEKAAPIQKPAPADYAVISEQNLFHPERKIPPEKQQEKVLPKPDLFLYGTLITDNTSYAFVEDRKSPHSTAGRGKRQLTLKKGESLGGYVLTEIEANRIVLVKGEERLVVRLDDKEKRREGAELSAFPTVPRVASGAPSFPAPISLPPQTAPGTARAVTSPASGNAAPPQPRTAPSSAQAEPSSHGPGGIGGSGTWPPTRSSVEQTQQKVQEGRLIRMQQMQNQ